MGRRPTPFSEILDCLCRFREREGHVDVPYRYVDEVTGFKLGLWASDCRRGRRQYNFEGHEIEALNKLGFRWNKIVYPPKPEPKVKRPPRLSWDVKFAKLQDYAQQHKGSTFVPLNYKDPDTQWLMGKWCQRLRRGKEKEMSPERIQQLNDIGFQWVVPNGIPWQTKLNALSKFYEKHGHYKVPMSYVDPDNGIKVGLFARLLRKSQRNPQFKMTRERIQQLHDMGFDFVDYVNGFGTADKKRPTPLLVQKLIHANAISDGENGIGNDDADAVACKDDDQEETDQEEDYDEDDNDDGDGSDAEYDTPHPPSGVVVAGTEGEEQLGVTLQSPEDEVQAILDSLLLKEQEQQQQTDGELPAKDSKNLKETTQILSPAEVVQMGQKRKAEGTTDEKPPRKKRARSVAAAAAAASVVPAIELANDGKVRTTKFTTKCNRQSAAVVLASRSSIEDMAPQQEAKEIVANLMKQFRISLPAAPAADGGDNNNNNFPKMAAEQEADDILALARYLAQKEMDLIFRRAQKEAETEAQRILERAKEQLAKLRPPHEYANKPETVTEGGAAAAATIPFAWEI